jgi:hypothetical protein
MSAQKFYADPKASWEFSNGAVGFRPTNGPFDTLGPYARVKNCPIGGTDLRLTCYATAHADTYFSIPACTRYKGKYISGFFSLRENAITFHVETRHRDRL